MPVLIATDFRVMRFEGRYYLKNKHYHITKRYVDAFGKAILFTRVLEADSQPAGFDAGPMLRGVIDAKSLKDVFLNRSAGHIRNALADCSLAICRFPSVPAYKAAGEACRMQIPVLAECMGDALDASWNHSAAGKLVAAYYYLSMKRWVRKSSFALYVTDRFLQERYPCPGRACAASNVALGAFADVNALDKRLARINAFDPQKPVLITVGAADNASKGYAAVIKALPLMKKRGVNAGYVVAGPGDTSPLAALAARLGVEENVEFTGELTSEQVRDRLFAADIYVQPSLQEGLPRAVIEAMACGCPCAGSRIGGIPELIQKEYLVKPGDPGDLREKLLRLCSKDNLLRAARENLARSRDFDETVLDTRRQAFFDCVKACLKKDDL